MSNYEGGGKSQILMKEIGASLKEYQWQIIGQSHQLAKG